MALLLCIYLFCLASLLLRRGEERFESMGGDVTIYGINDSSYHDATIDRTNDYANCTTCIYD